MADTGREKEDSGTWNLRKKEINKWCVRVCVCVCVHVCMCDKTVRIRQLKE